MNGEAPLSDLFRDLSRHTSTLIRQEVALAGAEIKDGARRMGRSAMRVAVGAVFAQLALVALTAAIILGLVALGWDAWLAAGVVGLAVGVAGAALMQRGLASMRTETIAPVQTVASLKETGQWLKNQTS